MAVIPADIEFLHTWTYKIYPENHILSICVGITELWVWYEAFVSVPELQM